jgi:hypothetical protein
MMHIKSDNGWPPVGTAHNLSNGERLAWDPSPFIRDTDPVGVKPKREISFFGFGNIGLVDVTRR